MCSDDLAVTSSPPGVYAPHRPAATVWSCPELRESDTRPALASGSLRSHCLPVSGQGGPPCARHGRRSGCGSAGSGWALRLQGAALPGPGPGPGPAPGPGRAVGPERQVPPPPGLRLGTSGTAGPCPGTAGKGGWLGAGLAFSHDPHSVPPVPTPVPTCSAGTRKPVSGQENVHMPQHPRRWARTSPSASEAGPGVAVREEETEVPGGPEPVRVGQPGSESPSRRHRGGPCPAEAPGKRRRGGQARGGGGLCWVPGEWSTREGEDKVILSLLCPPWAQVPR